MNITKHNFLVEKADDVIEIFSKAIKIATSGRPGPVHIDFPKDIQLASFPENFKMPNFSKKEEILENDEKINEVIKLLENSKKPILLIGQ
jgi:acetolactate synthase I/II/III large subunit